MRCGLFLVVLVVLGGMRTLEPALAAELELKQVASPATYTPLGRPVDVLGIAPGMPPAAVNAILVERYGKVETYQEKLGLEYRGTAVFAQLYTTKITAEKNGDRVAVLFGTPTTGNGVVEVSRQTDYFDAKQAPERAQVLGELTTKYGPPAEQPTSPTPQLTIVVWSYSMKGPALCPRSSCRADVGEGLDINNLQAYQRAARSGHPLAIVASVLSSTADPGRAASVVVRVSDAATKAQTLETAIAQMRGAAAGSGHPEACATTATC